MAYIAPPNPILPGPVLEPWRGCVMNPLTGRAIKVGSNTYRRLVRQGVIPPGAGDGHGDRKSVV